MNSLSRYCIAISLLPLIWFSTLHAQDSIRFKHISFREGLAQSPISSIFKDHQGFIWIGNWKGLTRYDGYEFKIFDHSDNDHASISNNRVNAICQDEYNNLWIGTSNGLNIYDRKTETFKHIGILKIKGGRNYVSSVILDSHKQMWMATFGGVKLVDRSRDSIVNIENFNQQQAKDLYDGITFTLFEDKQKHIWVGTKNGVRKFDPLSKKMLALPLAIRTHAALAQAKVLVIQQDKQDNLWFGTEHSGLFVYDAIAQSIRHFQFENNPNSLPSNWIKGLLVRDDHTIWVGTREGISIYTPSENKFRTFSHNRLDPQSLSDNTVWSFMADDDSNVWIGTFAGGINIYNPINANFSNIGERLGNELGLSNAVVNAIAQDKDGGLWIGTYSGGINYINHKTGESSDYSVRLDAKTSINNVKSLCQDGNGNVWIGALDGLARFNKATKTVNYYKFPVEGAKLSGSLVNYVLVEKEGIWAGTNGGGLRFVGLDGKYTTFLNSADTYSLSDNFVTSLLKDVNGNLWVGTQNGLNYFNKRTQQFKSYYKNGLKHALSHSTVLCLYRDSYNRLWIGTEGGGLNYFDESTEKFYAIGKELGLTERVIQAITEDNSRNIWASTDNGLFKIEIKSLVLPFSAPQIAVTHYTADDGLASNQFLTNAVLKSLDGKLFFGGINGLTSFYPEKILKNRYEPAIVLTDFLIKNKRVGIDEEGSVLKQSITETAEIALRYDQGFITLRFAALNYINAANNKYAYKLEGLTESDEWYYSGTQNAATYTNLKPGDYIFKVKASNNDGIWNEKPTVLKITVLPPWWMTWWAYSLYILAISTIAFVIIRFLRIRAKLKRDLYYEHLLNERQQEIYQMKLDFFTNISHEIRTPLTLIVGPLEKLLNMARSNHFIHDQLITIKNNADRLMRLMTELLDFRKAESGNMKLQFSECNIQRFSEEIFLSFKELAISRGINYTFAPLKDPINVFFDKDQLEKVLFNLLSNAFKFTANGGNITMTLHTRAEEQKEWVDIKISDNGKGIPEKYHDKLFENFFQVDARDRDIGTGIGLAFSKSIIDLHCGKIKIESRLAQESRPGETHFTISLLLGKEHVDASMLVPEYMNSDNLMLYRVQSDAKQIIETLAESSAEKRYTILIIEDNDEVRRFIKESLMPSYHILEGNDGVEGLKMASENMPDLIVSDVMMPNMDGLELCRRVKGDESTNHIPIILLTARATYIHQVNGFDKGADAYITKPFAIQLLELQIRNILASKEALRKKYATQLILEPKKLTLESPEEKFLQKLMKIIEDNIENPEFGVNDLSAEIGMSKTVLYKKVQALTNYSIGDFIKSIRLKQAALLLRQNKLTIAEVAFTVGFSDRKYFSKEFRKQFEMSPTDYINTCCDIKEA